MTSMTYLHSIADVISPRAGDMYGFETSPPSHVRSTYFLILMRFDFYISQHFFYQLRYIQSFKKSQSKHPMFEKLQTCCRRKPILRVFCQRFDKVANPYLLSLGCVSFTSRLRIIIFVGQPPLPSLSCETRYWGMLSTSLAFIV